jgi:hypothetical protein
MEWFTILIFFDLHRFATLHCNIFKRVIDPTTVLFNSVKNLKRLTWLTSIKPVKLTGLTYLATIKCTTCINALTDLTG